MLGCRQDALTKIEVLLTGIAVVECLRSRPGLLSTVAFERWLRQNLQKPSG